MEPRFSHDFSRVRIHTDAHAALSARTLGARAYTAGNHVVFGAGQFRPDTARGRELLAHELTHVVQQGRAAPANGRLPVTKPNDASERDADRAASAIRAGKTVPPLTRLAAPAIQRDVDPEASGRRVPVRLAVLGDCAEPEKIAEALPGARSMALGAERWFMDYPFLVPHQQRWVDRLLVAHFGSSSAAVRRVVHRRIISMSRTLEAANDGGIVFVCDEETATECGEHPWDMFVRRGERNRIHVCPNFYGAGLEARRFTLLHEAAHLAGAGDVSYLMRVGPIGASDCFDATPLSTENATQNADSIVWMVWCLTRQYGISIIPALEIEATPEQAP